jgi:hypothetical protein
MYKLSRLIYSFSEQYKRMLNTSVWQIRIVPWISDVEIDVNIVDFRHASLSAWTKKVCVPFAGDEQRPHIFLLSAVVRDNRIVSKRNSVVSSMIPYLIRPVLILAN